MFQRIQLIRPFGLVLLSISLFVVGCSSEPERSDTGEVKGTLTIEGKPLAGGTVLFVREDNPLIKVKATIGEDGTYSTGKRAPLGKVRIAIETESVKYGGGTVVPIPKRYNDPETAELSMEIVPGVNEFSIDLKP